MRNEVEMKNFKMKEHGKYVKTNKFLILEFQGKIFILLLRQSLVGHGDGRCWLFSFHKFMLSFTLSGSYQ